MMEMPLNQYLLSLDHNTSSHRCTMMAAITRYSNSEERASSGERDAVLCLQVFVRQYNWMKHDFHMITRCSMSHQVRASPLQNNAGLLNSSL